jgi:EmrB/QacA subfamily drug resistance transporter
MKAQASFRGSAWPGFIAVCTGLFMLLLDSTVLNVAQKAIRDDFAADLSVIQWVLDVYLLAFTIPLLVFGWCGDRFGQRRVFAAGTVVFVVSSALCALAGFAGGPALLIFARILQGIGGAAMLSQVLALVVVLFAPERRAAAFGVASSLGGLAAIMGPLVGGLLVEQAGWESVFLLNVPIGVTVLLAVRRYLPETKPSASTMRLDLGGMLLSGITLMAVSFAIIEGGHHSWSQPPVVASFVVAAVAGGALVWWERRTAHPMIPLELFRNRTFLAGALAMIVFNLGYSGIMLPLSVYLQDARGLSATEAGRVMVPVAVGIAVSAPLAGRWSERVGPSRMMAVGFVLSGLSLLAAGALIGIQIEIAAGLLGVAGVGVGMTVSQANTIPMRSTPAALAGRVSGALNVARMASMTLSIAIVSTVFHAASRRATSNEIERVHLPANVRDRVAEMSSSSSAEIASSGIPQGDARLPALSAAIHDGLTQGTALTLALAGTILLLGAVLTVLMLIRPARAQERAAASASSLAVAPH